LEHNCDAKGIVFPKFYYKIPTAASSTNRSIVGFNECDWIGYADDLAIVFKDKRSLEKGTTILNAVLRRFKLAINVGKTKTMIYNYKRPSEHCEHRW
jgi:hypothetical protein